LFKHLLLWYLDLYGWLWCFYYERYIKYLPFLVGGRQLYGPYSQRHAFGQWEGLTLCSLVVCFIMMVVRVIVFNFLIDHLFLLLIFV
jgi:hypothetical protein